MLASFIHRPSSLVLAWPYSPKLLSIFNGFGLTGCLERAVPRGRRGAAGFLLHGFESGAAAATCGGGGGLFLHGLVGLGPVDVKHLRGVRVDALPHLLAGLRLLGRVLLLLLLLLLLLHPLLVVELQHGKRLVESWILSPLSSMLAICGQRLLFIRVNANV